MSFKINYLKNVTIPWYDTIYESCNLKMFNLTHFKTIESHGARRQSCDKLNITLHLHPAASTIL